MAEITRILAANIPGHFLLVITTTASTRCLVQKFERSSDEILLDPCARKKSLQRKMTKDHYWNGVQENIGTFNKS